MIEPTTVLKVTDLAKSFGGLVALNHVSFEVRANQVKAIIGPNGAGKTTLLNTIGRFYTPESGDIEFMGHSLLSYPPHKVVKLGLARTFQHVQVSGHMTVLESIMVGAHCRTKQEMLGAILKLPLERREERWLLEEAERVMGIMGLQSLRDHPTGSLPHGEQKRVELAKALAGNPRLLMLDEPGAGLSTSETEHLAETLDKIRSTGVDILLVEHNVPLVMSIADEVMVLNYGQKIADGPPDEVAANPQVISAYLGEEAI